MHAISHSLAHRGPGASRARSRWQPYTSALNPACSTQHCSPQSYLHTPASSVVSASPASYISPVWHLDHTRKHAPVPITSQPSQTHANPVRDVQKNKYATRLVDQAVKSLCEIWRPEDIPEAFCVCPEDSNAATAALEKNPASSEVPLMQLPLRNCQLPSPESPSTQASPFCSPSTPYHTSSPPTGCIRADHLMPIRGFVHEVLRRSRTPTGVLQTALCYLEAVRSKVPGVLQQERLKEAHPEAFATEGSAERIILASALDRDDASLDLSGACESDSDTISEMFTTTVLPAHPQAPLTAPPTELIANSDAELVDPPPIRQTTSKTPSGPLPPLPPLPSPLLCPRRTFLACLILASKFMQDRSYSNKAWAKLAGLPPREIGRCERAVGEALEWRLWVGKSPSTPSPSSGSIHRAVARCRSELVSHWTTCTWPTPTTPTPSYTAHTAAVRTCSRSVSTLRRAATMPNLESNAGDGFPYAQADSAFYESSMAITMEATLVAEPDMDDFARAPALSALAAPALQASLYAGDVSSPPVSTPGLAYSPMSTTSSDDGDRVTQLSFRHIPSSLGYSEVCADASVGKPLARDFSPWTAGNAVFSGNKLVALEPYVVSPPARLPPLSEAVSNPVLLERSVGQHLPDFVGSFGHHDHGVGVANSYNTIVNWSVSGLH